MHGCTVIAHVSVAHVFRYYEEYLVVVSLAMVQCRVINSGTMPVKVLIMKHGSLMWSSPGQSES
ncbi:hypothetical protein BJ165DRAFT_1447675 [Panaeolus papilionaceus]|nr:hypothetical protein BJ165DRAFT_1447675 [Panaeolus papilionaceus]